MTSLTQFVYRAKLEKPTSNRYRDFVTTVDFCRLFPDILFKAFFYLMHQPSITRHHSAPFFATCAQLRALRGYRKCHWFCPSDCIALPYVPGSRVGRPSPPDTPALDKA